MTKDGDIAASVRDRLLNRSHETGDDFNFMLQRYAAERFLYRLGKSAHREKYVLKGAMLFALWGGSIYRPTHDLDLTGYGAGEAKQVLAAFADICVLGGGGDGIVFDPATLKAQSIREDAEYDGLRVTCIARLGSAQIPMQIDIGFGNAIEPPASDEEYPTLLDAPAPRIRAYPREAVIAEKLHAMVFLGVRNSRMKDFHDVHALAMQFAFEGATLARAIRATFARRKTKIEAALPAALTIAFYADATHAEQWRAYIARNRLTAVPADFAQIGERLLKFLEPLWRVLAAGEDFALHWPPSGPWGTPP